MFGRGEGCIPPCNTDYCTLRHSFQFTLFPTSPWYHSLSSPSPTSMLDLVLYLWPNPLFALPCIFLTSILLLYYFTAVDLNPGKNGLVYFHKISSTALKKTLTISIQLKAYKKFALKLKYFFIYLFSHKNCLSACY